MRTVTVSYLAAVVLVLAACSDESSDQTQARETPNSEASATPQSRCEKASRGLLRAIAAGLEGSGGKGALKRGAVVRSKDFEKVYMVAAEIDGPGLGGDGDVGVWATNSPSGDGVIYAVDSVAQEFSDWGDADTTAAQIDQSADGVDNARACVEG